MTNKNELPLGNVSPKLCKSQQGSPRVAKFSFTFASFFLPVSKICQALSSVAKSKLKKRIIAKSCQEVPRHSSKLFHLSGCFTSIENQLSVWIAIFHKKSKQFLICHN